MSFSQSPYASVWFKTVKTVEGVRKGKIKFNPHYPFILVAATSYPEALVIWGEFWIDFIVAMIWMLAAYWMLSSLFPWILLKTGKIWNGNADFISLQKIIGLAQIPVLLTIPYRLIIYLLTDEFLFDDEVNLLLQFVVSIFYLRIMIIGISKVQNFSYGIAILNLLLQLIPLVMLRLSMGN